MSRQDFLFNSSTPPYPLQQPAADNLHKDDEMDQCRLPTEVCERIIDFTSYGRSRFHFPSYLGDLRACALTCRKWLPRSRLNLYRCVWFQERRNLERVSQAIANHPFLAEFVQELILGNPNPGCASHRTHDPGSIAFKFFRAELVQELISGNPALISLEEPRKDQYIPFASDTLVRALQNVRVLTLSHFHWHALHPRYHETAAQYSIVELNIIGGCFNTFPDLLRVVWAFHHLRTLRLIDVKFERMSNNNLESIAQKRPTLCHELIDLHVVGIFFVPGASFIPCGCFGTNITSLTLSWAEISWAKAAWAKVSPAEKETETEETEETETTQTNHHVPYLRFLPRLQRLTWRVVKGWNLGTSEDLISFSLYIGSVLETGLHERSTLARVTLHFEACDTDASMLRRQFIEDMFSLKFFIIFERSQRVHRLQLLQLIIPERRWSKYDAFWWRQQLDLRVLPNTEVAVHIDTSDTGTVKLWNDEQSGPDEMYWDGDKAFSFNNMFGELTTLYESRKQPISEISDPTTDTCSTQPTLLEHLARLRSYKKYRGWKLSRGRRGKQKFNDDISDSE